MANKALITRRDDTDLVDPKVLEDIGNPVELETQQGALVELKDISQAERIEALGYRVKFLPNTDILKVGRYTIEIEGSQSNERPEVPPELEVPQPLVETWPHHLVQLKLPPSEQEITTIEKAGLEVVEPISAYGLFVVGNPNQVESLKNYPRVAWTGPFKPAYRIEPGLFGVEGKIQYLRIGIYPQSEQSKVTQTLRAADATIISESGPPEGYSGGYWKIIAEVNADLLYQIARLPGVRWIEFASAKPELDSEREAQVVARNLNGTSAPVPGYQKWLAERAVSGKGVVIAICDTGVSQNENNKGHHDLRGRQVAFKDYTGGLNMTDTHGHGTLVAGLAVGNAATGIKDGTRVDIFPCGRGSEFLCGQGVAPEAEYITQNALLMVNWPPADFRPLTAFAVENGAHIMNNSWNDDGPAGAGYTSNAQLFDELVRHPNSKTQELDNLIIVFSAGNEGPLASTITPPHEAKNIIVVGCSLTYLPGFGDGVEPDNINGIWRLSSRGPARDDRTLPNIVAPGNTAVSASTGPGDRYTVGIGTSMASGLVSGACALIIEWWLKKVSKNKKRPSPAMMKAILINGAEDIGGGPDGNGGIVPHIPNNIQGWGRISLADIINKSSEPGPGNKLFFDQQQEFTGTQQTHTIRVAPATTSQRMRITLVWTDAPGSTNTSPVLVNDLDLEVTETATGNIYKGNVFDRDGFSITGGKFDTINNIECVYIRSPGGTYNVTVRAQSLRGNARPPFDNKPWQDFALVIDNAKEMP